MNTFKEKSNYQLYRESILKIRNIEFGFISNPRKENGDLGDLFCEKCGTQTGAYVIIQNDTPDFINKIHLCKGCLLQAIDEINKKILE